MNEMRTIVGSDDVKERRPPRRPGRVVVINDISAMKGGATGVALTSVGLIRAAGVPVTFITGDDAANADPIVKAGAHVALGGEHILSGPRIEAAARGLYNRAAARGLAEWIAGHDTPGTIYHLHGWSKILSPSIFRALRPVSARLIVHAHDFFLVCPNGGYFDFPRGQPCAKAALSLGCLACSCDRRSYAHKLWRAGRLALSRAMFDLASVGRVLAVHEAMVPLLQRAGLKDAPVGVLRNPVMPWSRPRIAAERNGSFVFVGRLDWDKGVDLLAAAARRAGVRLRMVGTGPLHETLARQYPEIEITGWRAREDIAELCRDARAIVLPTRSREAFGLAALEAMMSGLPAVISERATIAGETVNEGFGLACNPQDEAALADLLAQLRRDDVAVARMSRTAHANARALAPTPGEWCARLLDTYAATLDGATAESVKNSRLEGR